MMVNPCVMLADCTLSYMALTDHWLCERMAFRQGNASPRKIQVRMKAKSSKIIKMKVTFFNYEYQIQN